MQVLRQRSSVIVLLGGGLALASHYTAYLVLLHLRATRNR